MTTHRISIRHLVEFVERSGDINFRFSSRSSAQEGIRGHQRLQKSRGDAYVAEKEVSYAHSAGDICLEVGGRVDGYYPDTSPLEVEEIKTLRVMPDALPAAISQLHWAQAMAYAFLLAQEHDAQEVLVRLCYLQLDDDSETTVERTFRQAELATFFQQVIDKYLQWIAANRAWQQRRNEAIADLAFPYGDYRSGQRDMAVSVYRTMRDGGQLVLQAPTGIGKTMASLFPAVKALRESGYEKVFFLSAKTSGKEMAERSLDDIKSRGLALRDITLTAKDKICFNPGSPCEPQHCEYARGYYDRLPGVLSQCLEDTASLRRADIEAIAREHSLCPFELSLDLSRIADIVICDYNYVFDPNVYLRRYFDDDNGQYALLIDESHNLVDRGRDMFSARINKSDYLAVRKSVSGSLPLIARRLARVNEQILAIKRPHKDVFTSTGHLVLEELPGELLKALRHFCDAAEEWLADNQPAPFQEGLLQLYFDSLRFLRTAEWFDENYACLLEQTRAGVMVRLYNINPAPGLARAMARVRASICFSATMTPQPYFKELLGIGETAGWYRIDSPFDPANLGVFSAAYISTAWRDRDASLVDLVDLIATVAARRTGNYMVFFPSYEYLDRALALFVERYPAFEALSQTPGMDEPARDAFLESFHENARITSLVGFAVMGGVFGEGVDLKGTRLIGAIIVGVGLPRIGIERDLVRDYFDAAPGKSAPTNGFAFAYQFPGINRVLQTAGRVIRTESDRGIVCLVDTRFAETRYRRLLPGEWQVQPVDASEQLALAIDSFWQAG